MVAFFGWWRQNLRVHFRGQCTENLGKFSKNGFKSLRFGKLSRKFLNICKVIKNNSSFGEHDLAKIRIYTSKWRCVWAKPSYTEQISIFGEIKSNLWIFNSIINSKLNCEQAWKIIFRNCRQRRHQDFGSGKHFRGRPRMGSGGGAHRTPENLRKFSKCFLSK